MSHGLPLVIGISVAASASLDCNLVACAYHLRSLRIDCNSIVQYLRAGSRVSSAVCKVLC